MSGAKHTSGPLTIKPDGDLFMVVQDRRDAVVFTAAFCSEGDATLYAAAPDLLADGAVLLDRLAEFDGELLDDEVARRFLGHVSPAIARFSAAIAKATGDA